MIEHGEDRMASSNPSMIFAPASAGISTFKSCNKNSAIMMALCEGLFMFLRKLAGWFILVGLAVALVLLIQKCSG